jgi:predicted DNA-binding ribbon-helix-helix protein
MSNLDATMLAAERATRQRPGACNSAAERVRHALVATRETPAETHVQPRSFRLGKNGRRVSIRLESEFRAGLEQLCAARGVEADEFLAEVRAGSTGNFSAAVRCAILAWFRSGAAAAAKQGGRS